jgi:predicted phage terminase large subunit-like protein
MLEKTRINLETQGNAADWFALYQQQPRPQEGEMLSADDFIIKEKHEVPPGLHWVRYCDLAISEKRQADFNSSIAMAKDKEANLWLRDRIKEKGWDQAKRAFKHAMRSDNEKGTEWGFEANAFQELAVRELQNDPDLIGVTMRGIKAVGDKVSRFRPFASRAKAKKVFLVRGSWNESFIGEMIDFPRGQHDDDADSCSGGMAMLEEPRTTRMHSAVAG